MSIEDRDYILRLRGYCSLNQGVAGCEQSVLVSKLNVGLAVLKWREQQHWQALCSRKVMCFDSSAMPSGTHASFETVQQAFEILV